MAKSVALINTTVDNIEGGGVGGKNSIDKQMVTDISRKNMKNIKEHDIVFIVRSLTTYTRTPVTLLFNFIFRGVLHVNIGSGYYTCKCIYVCVCACMSRRRNEHAISIQQERTLSFHRTRRSLSRLWSLYCI